jgi:translation initiation factor IF-1
MPPNMKGGKGYKKGKHNDADPKMIQWNEEEGQMIGRVLKSVGNRRFRVYCNDNKERLCRLCGSMRKSDFVNEGSLVVMGIRTLSSVTSDHSSSKNMEGGDILSTIDSRLYGKLKKEPGLNPALFTNIEEQDITQVKKKVEAGLMDDDFFEHENSDEEDNEEGNKKKAGETSAKERDIAMAAKRSQKAAADDFINIDDI